MDKVYYFMGIILPGLSARSRLGKPSVCWMEPSLQSSATAPLAARMTKKLNVALCNFAHPITYYNNWYMETKR